MVIAIVLFVLGTPRRWFHDQPRSAAAARPGVQLIAQGSDTETYRLPAGILAPQKRATKSTPELERETHDILDRNVPELHDQTFQIVQIGPVLGSDGAVLYYDVTIRQ